MGFQRKSPEWFLTIFLIPFVLIGLVLIGVIFYDLLKLFNPHVEVTLSTRLQLGRTTELSWLTKGRVSALKKLSITLEGKEEAKSTRGTSTCTDKETFAAIPIRETTAAFDMRSGSASLSVPATQMHSFEAPNNKILWIIRTKGEVAFLPDVNEELSVTVAPAPGKAGAT